MYEVAGQMLKTALDARDAKVQRKLKTIDLQLKKLKIEKDERDQDGQSGQILDRNSLMKFLENDSGDESADK